MILMHWAHFPTYADCHKIIDDFGVLHENAFSQAPGYNRAKAMAWASAYRFKNGQTFEQSGMRSEGAIVEEH